MHLKVVDFPLPLKPNKPNFSFGSNPKYKFLTARLFKPKQLKNVLETLLIIVVNKLELFKTFCFSFFMYFLPISSFVCVFKFSFFVVVFLFVVVIKFSFNLFSSSKFEFSMFVISLEYSTKILSFKSYFLKYNSNKM